MDSMNSEVENLNESGWPGFLRAVPGSQEPQPEFSICTLVTDSRRYLEMVNSFVDHGFDPSKCEYFFIDNRTDNRLDAYQGLNKFLLEARGRYIIFCHQDVTLLEDDLLVLRQRLSEVDDIDPEWAICGNSGILGLGKSAIRISDPWGENQATTTFPVRVTSVDENFMLVRRDANLALSRDMSGFHLYGSDLSIIADILGYTTWVIDFHLRHEGAGIIDHDFLESRARAAAKWRRALRARWIATNCTFYLISGIPGLGRASELLASRFLRNIHNRISRKNSGVRDVRLAGVGSFSPARE